MSLVNYLFPKVNLEKCFSEALEDKTISDRISEENSCEKLKHYLREVKEENSFLSGFASFVDVYDKALVPFRVMGDVLSLFTAGAMGVTISSAKELIEAPVKLVYNLYYATKTKNIGMFLYNLAYEGASWACPGSLIDLNNRYVKQVQDHIRDEAKLRFLKR